MSTKSRLKGETPICPGTTPDSGLWLKASGRLEFRSKRGRVRFNSALLARLLRGATSELRVKMVRPRLAGTLAATLLLLRCAGRPVAVIALKLASHRAGRKLVSGMKSVPLVLGGERALISPHWVQAGPHRRLSVAGTRLQSNDPRVLRIKGGRVLRLRLAWTQATVPDRQVWVILDRSRPDPSR
ncbi:MAG TPA: hypothetical protein VHD62_09610 [Opitutaceae bacterium]|nr:hypothetical protein [Opitutaceae bacterium]